MSDLRAQIWQKLAQHPAVTLEDLFSQNASRVEDFSSRLDLGENGVLFDWSKTHLTSDIVSEFAELAEVSGFDDARDRLLTGGIVNLSEGRAAEHTAQRGIGNEASVEEAAALHARMRMLVEAVHEGVFGEIRHLIHIGIGGSALGPGLAIDALGRDLRLVEVHVVSNIDGVALEEAFAACDPHKTLVAIASKSFTTVETMVNAASTIKWLGDNGVEDPSGQVIAITADPEKAVEWGVDETRILLFPESVGGRYSLWSNIAFPIALALGWEDFELMLQGAAMMDEHFRDTPFEANIAVRAACSDLYYSRIKGAQTRAVFAYDERLRLLPAYLQQLEMESNGKSIAQDGTRIDGVTAPITWGGLGTDAQHAVFQLLHQGTHLVPVDFIASAAAGDELDPSHHRLLLLNCFAQGAALMAGKASSDPSRYYEGNRPSATLLADDLDALALGAIIAFYEHRTFVNAVLLGVNPFDQFGVELGKEIARKISDGDQAFDASTLALLAAAGIAG